MGIIEFGIMLLVAGTCGAIAQFVTGYTRGGCPVSVVVGFIGAYAGPRVAERFAWPELFILRLGDLEMPIVWSVIGAVVLVLLVNLATHHRRF